MGIFYSYCTRCNNELKYFIEYENDGIECDVCFHSNTDKEIKGTFFKYSDSDGILKIWGEEEMEKVK